MSRPIILGVALSNRIIGLAVATSEDLEHVAMHDARKVDDIVDRAHRLHDRLLHLVNRYQPTHMVVVGHGSGEGPIDAAVPISLLLAKALRAFAESHQLIHVEMTRAAVRERFTDLRTVGAISKALVRRFPELRHRALPDRPRIRGDDIERARIPVLMAVAAADIVLRDTIIQTL